MALVKLRQFYIDILLDASNKTPLKIFSDKFEQDPSIVFKKQMSEHQTYANQQWELNTAE